MTDTSKAAEQQQQQQPMDAVVEALKSAAKEMIKDAPPAALDAIIAYYKELLHEMEQARKPKLNERDQAMVNDLKKLFPGATGFIAALEQKLTMNRSDPPMITGPLPVYIDASSGPSAVVGTIAVAPAALTITPATPAEPEPEKPQPKTGIAKIVESLPLLRACSDANVAYSAYNGVARVDELDKAWNEAAGVPRDGMRPDAYLDAHSPVGVRRSPWNGIMYAVRRNETCVLYCKHKDDGWTRDTWTATLSHLNDNGVGCFIVCEIRGTSYWALRWELPQ